MKFPTKSILIFLLATGCWQLATDPVLAGSIGLSLAPPLVEANIRPGESVTAVFNLQNNSEKEQVFVARIVPFTPEDDSGHPVLKPNLTPEWLKYFSLKNDVLELGQPFSLGPNQNQELILQVKVPSRASLTDLYATLLVNSLVDDGTSGSTVGTAIGSNLLISISPISHPPALVKIIDFTPSPSSYLFRYGDTYIADNLKPIRFSAGTKNLGKYFTKTSGSLRVSSDDKAVFTQNLLPLNLLANGQRRLEGSPSGELVFNPQLIHLGLYQVSLDLRSDNSSSHSEITLLLLPLKFTILLILVVVPVFLIIKKRLSKQPQDI